MSDFKISAVKLPNWAVGDNLQDIMLVQIRGVLDFNTTPKLHQVLDDCLALHIYKFILDLKQVTYLASTGLGAFINLRKTLEEHHGHVVFLRPSPQVKMAFGLFEFDPFTTITDDIESSLDELQR